MRKLVRPIPPAIFTDKNGPAETEKKEAIAYYTRKHEKGEKKFVYAFYSSEAAKEAIAQVSHNKCAYCEAEARAGYDGDIEHFRPKGEVTEEGGESIKPGYYWLGADWENLFLSCSHCNQLRRQPTIDGKKITMGKKNQFPLSKGSKRIKSHDGDVKLEEPFRLLINPCIDDPRDHLRFAENGVIEAKKLPDNTYDRKGSVSIGVLALQRKLLVESREQRAILLRSALARYEEAVNEYNLTAEYLPAELKKLKQKNLAGMISDICIFTDRKQPYSGMCFQLVSDFMKARNWNFPVDYP